jgi:chorismate--pyruvate lyase
MLPLCWTPAAPFGPVHSPLAQPGSLTARLARHGRVTVDVLASGWRAARIDETNELGLAHAGERVYARRVCVRLDGRPAVLAESVTTRAGIAGPWRGLRTLGNRPLAALLWTDPMIGRSPFRFVRAGPGFLPLPGQDRPLPARRSCFRRGGEPLLVLESFVGLPWPRGGLMPRKRSWLLE